MWDPSQKSQILLLNYIIKYYGNWCLIMSFWVFQFLFLKKGRKKKGNLLEVSRMQRRLQRRSMEKRRGAVSHPSADSSRFCVNECCPTYDERCMDWRRGRPYLLAPKAWYVTWLPRRKRQKWVLVILRKKKQYNWFLWRSGNKWINKI